MHQNRIPETREDAPSWQMLLARQLADDLASGELELPSFPDVVIRVREALADENASLDRVARVISADPALAARLLRIANSAALHRGGKPVTSLRVAITRMGANLARSTVLSFALKQIRRAEECRGIAGELEAVWQRSTLVAAVSHAVARTVDEVAADEAMLAGLLHQIGKLYILTRSAKHRAVAGNKAALATIMDEWHANIAKAILENWGLPDEICEAVARQDEFEEEPRAGRISLAEILVTGIILADHFDDSSGLELDVEGSGWFQRMRLDVARCRRLLEDSRGQILELRQALDG
jgi:HD-like signal output (HDOD) protein